MKLNIFSIPIYIGNINLNKIKIINKGFKKNWHSQTKSSFTFQNTLEEESAQYLLHTIENLIVNEITKPHRLILQNVWENRYEEGDFQEKHSHAQSHFSFVIYKEIDEAKTVFFNPSEKLMQSYYGEEFINTNNFFKEVFKPECRKGQIIIFPSFLEHMVLRHNNSVTYAGNITIEMLKEK
tara:strand:- start:188 stop:730 length:543 start_codon:yes stop_codon:yes gene_type:complete